MKKTMTAVCVLLCMAILCACATGQDRKTDLEDTEGEREERVVTAPGEEAVPPEGQTDNIQQEAAPSGRQTDGIQQEEVPSDKKTDSKQQESVSSDRQTNGIQQEEVPSDKKADSTQQEAVPSDGQTADVQDGGTNEKEQDTLASLPMQGLMHGNPGGIGLGLLVYVLPEQDGEDYKLCFFKEGNKVADFEKPMSETVYYSLEMADYVFPDVRENNAPVGKFIEIYFFDTVTIGEGTAGLAVVATYDVNGEACYDTRIYRWDGTGYSVEGKLTQEFNEKYCSAEEYPVEELYHL
ncbi:MAG: hypothetical protein K2O16_11615 [Lachnospiraceae bacterium]|nr:hypothetical protein [Lachnospiraceae bacterium]